MLLEELKNTNFPYSPTIVRDLIIQNRDKYGYVRTVTKNIIFLMMKRIILRGVVTYSNINRNRNNDVVRSDDDMVNEIYFVLDGCVDKFNTDKNKDFYLYFSSSVSRRMSRMSNYKRVVDGAISFSKYESQIDKDSEVSIEEMLEDRKVQDMDEGDTFAFIDSIEFDIIEQKVLGSIKSGRGVKDIQNENGISKVQYETVMNSIRNKIVYEESKYEVLSKIMHKL